MCDADGYSLADALERYRADLVTRMRAADEQMRTGATPAARMAAAARQEELIETYTARFGPMESAPSMVGPLADQ